jgi:hypothetical protein
MPNNTDQGPVEFDHRAFPINETRKLMGGISRSHVYAVVSRGKLKLTKLGGRSVVTGRSIRKCLDSGTQA